MQSVLLHRAQPPCTCPARQRFSAAPLSARQPLRSLPVLQAKPTKAADFKGLSEEDIEKEVEAFKMELFKLRFQQARKEAFKPSDFRWHRKKIAQLLTVKRQREIEQGISSRQSRRIQKNKNIKAGFAQF